MPWCPAFLNLMSHPCFAMLGLTQCRGCSQKTHMQLCSFPSRFPQHPGDAQPLHGADRAAEHGGTQADPKGSRDPDGSRDEGRVSQINTTWVHAGSGIARAQPFPHLEKATAVAAMAANRDAGRVRLTLGRQQVGSRVFPFIFSS